MKNRILLVEDNPIIVVYGIELLKQLGCSCDTASNGFEAIEAVREGNYHLVLMDCEMPEMDGFEATRRIRMLEADGTLDGRLPIIAQTANAFDGDRERCLDAGMDDYLSKPIQIEEFVGVLKRFLPDTCASSAKDEQIPHQRDSKKAL